MDRDEENGGQKFFVQNMVVKSTLSLIQITNISISEATIQLPVCLFWTSQDSLIEKNKRAHQQELEQLTQKLKNAIDVRDDQRCCVIINAVKELHKKYEYEMVDDNNGAEKWGFTQWASWLNHDWIFLVCFI